MKDYFAEWLKHQPHKAQFWLTALAGSVLLGLALIAMLSEWRSGERMMLWFTTAAVSVLAASAFLYKQASSAQRQTPPALAKYIAGAPLGETRRLAVEMRIADALFETGQSMIIADAQRKIIRVNKAFTAMTGYRAEDVIGQDPALCAKKCEFPHKMYAQMLESLAHDGYWQGEVWDRHKNGEAYPKQLTIRAIYNDHGAVTHYLGVYQDLSGNKQTADEIERLAFYDPLTGLPNRRLLQERLKQALAGSQRSRGKGGLLFIDLDNFKILNDTLGHDKGDLLLQKVAERLSACVRQGDTVARLGGDEFVVVLENLSEHALEAAKHAELICAKIQTSLCQPYLLDNYDYRSTPSIGATLFSGHEQTMDELLKQADIAMYQAKNLGRNALCFFDPQMQAAITARVELEADLRQAVRERQFVLYYQPQVGEANRVVGAEVLVRWRHPHRGLIRPKEFIPLLEETGLIHGWGLWVLESACRQIKAWENSPAAAHLQLAVNVSARQFRQADFVGNVRGIIARSGINPARLKLELTESMVADNIEDMVQKMRALRALGVRFSLDDFGAGYSSLASLKKLPLDQLKIDQSFVRDILSDPDDAMIVRTIIAMANHLGMEVIAEGVETEAQRRFLEQNNCRVCQGYLYSEPAPIESLEAFLDISNRRGAAA
ncbi:MAG: EAL domain-containing protein [Methylomonas sp.]|jgi:diguanylate cyclase (GGDEF)-like protein/PAS domain S-box-containing protein